MRAYRILAALAVLGLFSALRVNAQVAPPASTGNGKSGVPVEITADETNYEGGWATASGNVVVRYGPDLLYADRTTYDEGKHVVTAEGNVRIYVAGRVYRGEHMVYNFDTKAVTSTDFSIAAFPAFAKGQAVTTPEPNHYRVTNGYITTENREHPTYKLRAHTLEIYPDDRVVMKDAVLYVGDVPVFWFPYYAQSVKSQESSFTIRGGSSSRFGGEVFATMNWKVSDQLDLTFHEDYRTKRGDGGGVDVAYKPVKNGSGLFSGYYIHDDDFTENPTNLPRSPIGADRYRFELQQFTPLGEGFEARINANVWSDPYVTEDFFQNEFAEQRMPDNSLELLQRGSDYEASLTGRVQANRFFDTTDRAPEFKLEIKPTKFFAGLPLEYETETSMTHFIKTFSNQQYFYPNVPKDYAADRWDTYHLFLYPKQYFGWLNVTPHLGLRGTAWSHDNLDVGTPAAGNSDTAGPSIGRVVVDTGADISVKLSRTWSNVKDSALGIDGLRHVMTPFVNAQVVETSMGSQDVRGFDDRLPNTWANPIGFPAYNSIDSIDRQIVVRQGIRNELQTKRDGLNWNLIDWSIFTDANLVGTYNEEQTYTRDTYGHAYNELEINPFPWLSFASRDAFDISGNSYTMYDNSVTWKPDRSLKLSLGDRLLQNTTILDSYGLPIPDTNQVYIRTFYRLNEHWQVETLDSFDTDNSSLAEQNYTIYRDLSAWQLGLTFMQRNNQGGDNETAVMLTLTLKAFPNASVRASE